MSLDYQETVARSEQAFWAGGVGRLDKATGRAMPIALVSPFADVISRNDILIRVLLCRCADAFAAGRGVCTDAARIWGQC